MERPELLRVTGLSKSYRIGSGTLRVLEDVNFAMAEGEVLAVMGQSGSGKSTLLHQIGLLDKPDGGRVFFRGQEMPLTGNRAAGARNVHFGFVFQFYHLLPEFNALENVLMPAMILHDWLGWRRQKGAIKKRAEALLERVGLSDRVRHRPPEMSGGERQRVAIARALINNPSVLLCDEPTGNLDRKTAEGVKDLLWELNRSDRQGMIVVTHDPVLAARADRTLALEDGRLT
ncbi:MAG: ABC transporter ATP-binding protein, partial [Planctomycetota bacterium]|nr:ABC transporter ATP-binding protein [Planctomycetota bacterium]